MMQALRNHGSDARYIPWSCVSSPATSLLCWSSSGDSKDDIQISLQNADSLTADIKGLANTIEQIETVPYTYYY